MLQPEIILIGWYCRGGKHVEANCVRPNLVTRACDPREETRGSGIIRCRKPGILAKIELRIHFNGQSDSSLKRIIPEPHVPSRGSQARGMRLCQALFVNTEGLILRLQFSLKICVHSSASRVFYFASFPIVQKLLLKSQISIIDIWYNMPSWTKRRTVWPIFRSF
jgi:hypothetical protein